MALRTRAWSCSRATTRRASASSPTSRASRPRTWSPTRWRHWSSTGASSTARCVCAATVSRLGPGESDAVLRHPAALASRLGAWASPQSQPPQAATELERPLGGGARTRFEGDRGRARDRSHWGGYLLRPAEVEFWQGQQARLHDRFLYTRERRRLEHRAAGALGARLSGRARGRARSRRPPRRSRRGPRRPGRRRPFPCGRRRPRARSARRRWRTW